MSKRALPEVMFQVWYAGIDLISIVTITESMLQKEFKGSRLPQI